MQDSDYAAAVEKPLAEEPDDSALQLGNMARLDTATCVIGWCTIGS